MNGGEGGRNINSEVHVMWVPVTSHDVTSGCGDMKRSCEYIE